MKDMFKKLMKFIGLDNSSNCLYNSFIIGNTCYIVLEFDDDKSIIYSKIIDLIIKNKHEFYWFSSYYEFEKYIDYLDYNCEGYLFIIIA